MRISKSLLLACVVAFCVSLAVRADDNAAQAAARAALMEKMQELNSGQSNNPAPPPPMTPAPAPEMTPPVATPPPAPPQTPEQQVQVIEEERAALLQQTNLPPAMLPPPQPVVPETHAPAPAPVMVPPMAMTNSISPSGPQPTTIPASTEKRGFFSRIFHPFHHSAVAEEEPMKPTTSAYGGKNSGFTPIVPPPAPVSPEKDAKLQALLEKYKADQITPEQYQTGRAEILNSP